MKRILIIALLLLSFGVYASAQYKYEFTTVKQNPATSVKDQGKTGTCWCFATNSFIESELIRMGAQISVEGRLAIIEGGAPLTAAPVKATDLRAGAAMIIAALEVKGTTEISSIQYIERGYEDVVEKFRALGADIKKVYFTGDNEEELGA